MQNEGMVLVFYDLSSSRSILFRTVVRLRWNEHVFVKLSIIGALSCQIPEVFLASLI
jgi:hypothetical protein